MTFFAVVGVLALVYAAYYFYSKHKYGERTSKEPGSAKDSSDNKKHL